MVAGSYFGFRLLRSLSLGVFFAVASFVYLPAAAAQGAAPTLISHEDSTRAISFESVTQQREPFSTTAPVAFGTDNQTRIMLFAMNLTLQTGDNVSSISA